MEDFDGTETPPNEDLIPCKICGRRFFAKVLKKHTPICQKSSIKKRKVFDSSRQRAEGTDISTVKPLKPKLHITSSTSKTDKAEPPKKQSNWRRKHEEFISTIRAAKGLTQVMKEGGPLPPPPPPSYDPGEPRRRACLPSLLNFFLLIISLGRDDQKSSVEVDHPVGQLTKFCHECGTRYPVESARFCCECGVRRMCM
nr:zinc finger C2HC domain-containing protein 1A-like [Paramormyrops kingsleyae]